MKRPTLEVVVAVLVLLSACAQGAVIRVGPDRPYKRPSEAAPLARDGDVIEIDAGTYRGDTAVWRQNRLTLRGVGKSFAHLQAAGASAEGKAIWVIKGKNVAVENIEFSGAAVSDRNGAGIRQEGTGLVVRNCYFHNNENGILGGAGELLVEHSEFAHNGAGDGQSHNIYIGERTERFTLRYSYLHHARVGHLVKSRARENHILYNRITDETGGSASYEVEMPNGGIAYLVGNVVQQGPHTENSTIISFGAEGLRSGGSELYLVNNTIVNDNSQAQFLRVAPGVKRVLAVNNLIVGNGTFNGGGVESVSNMVTRDAPFADRANHDYRLTNRAKAIDAGVDPGAVNGVSLRPTVQYSHPRKYELRALSGAFDIGAYEFVNSNIGQVRKQ